MPQAQEAGAEPQLGALPSNHTLVPGCMLTLYLPAPHPLAARYARSQYFMDVKCPGCFAITTVFSHAHSVVMCASCSQVLAQPTGGKARLTEGCSFRRKVSWRRR